MFSLWVYYTFFPQSFLSYNFLSFNLVLDEKVRKKTTSGS